jgi:hypothetical protein
MVEPSWQAVVTPGTVAGGGCEDVASSVVVVLMLASAWGQLPALAVP